MANNDSYSTNQNTLLTVLQPGVLSNDTDADPNTTLTAQVVSNPSNAASFTLNSNGSFSYTPVTNYTGPTVSPTEPTTVKRTAMWRR